MRRMSLLAAIALIGIFQSSFQSFAVAQVLGAASGSRPHAQYEYHFDRNALRDIRRAGDSIIALTDSGNLLRFDLTTLQLAREWFGPSPALCLGQRVSGELIVGFADGQISRLDPKSLALTELMRLPSRIMFLAFRGGDAGTASTSGLVAVIEGTRSVEHYGRRLSAANSPSLGGRTRRCQCFSVSAPAPSRFGDSSSGLGCSGLASLVAWSVVSLPGGLRATSPFEPTGLGFTWSRSWCSPQVPIMTSA